VENILIRPSDITFFPSDHSTPLNLLFLRTFFFKVVGAAYLLAPKGKQEYRTVCNHHHWGKCLVHSVDMIQLNDLICDIHNNLHMVEILVSFRPRWR
jgi:hypothetical protein